MPDGDFQEELTSRRLSQALSEDQGSEPCVLGFGRFPGLGLRVHSRVEPMCFKYGGSIS